MATQSRVEDLLRQINRELVTAGLEVELASFDSAKVRLSLQSACRGCRIEADQALSEVRGAFAVVFGDGVEVCWA